MDKIREKLKNLPSLPGVYIMKDEGGTVIYVGKSKCLKNRVTQYFKKSGHGGKVGAMVENIRDFEYIVTDSETEALVLECNLIKKYMPHYNILLKDDKQYPYIKITAEKYPKLLLARKAEKDGAEYFGPYTAGVANDTLEVIRKIFKIPTCKRKFPRDIGKERPCLNYHINMCMAPCNGNISEEEYAAVFSQIKSFLEGRISETVKSLKSQMFAYSEALEFEKAAAVRDKIERLKQLGEKQKITVYGRSDRDVVAAVCDDGLANVQILNIREGKVIGRNRIWLACNLNEDKSAVLSSFLTQYYLNCEFIPGNILINGEIEDKEAIENWLTEKSGYKVRLTVPQKGAGLDLIKLAEKNAMQDISDSKKLKSAQKDANKSALEQLETTLGLKLNRIEAYDISNTQGANSVGSMIVFENGVPEKSEYRYFKIKSVDGIDDYKSTLEVITRRFRRWTEKQDEKFSKMPDAVFADGGLAHAHVIAAAVSSAGLDIPVFGMVKDTTHKTRALLTTDGEIIMLTDEAFRLVCEIQEEVHRVAITFHRRLMSKDMSRSVLDDIEGIGAVKKRRLLRHFGSVAKIKSATVEQLMNADGISAKNAEVIYRFFHE